MTRLTIEGLDVPVAGKPVLQDVSFTANGGALIGLVGPNGAGKSTLARTISGLISPTAGTLTLDGIPLPSLGRREAARRIAYLAQGDAVHWPLAVQATVELGRTPHFGRLGIAAPRDKAAVRMAMRRAGVQDFAARNIRQLSGGERARVLLARALAVEASVLVDDEPVGALDPHHALKIMALLREEAARGVLVIAVLHDLALATRFCDHLLVLRAGRLVADGLPHTVLSPSGMEQHYAVTGHHGAHDAERFVIPWRALEPASSPLNNTQGHTA